MAETGNLNTDNFANFLFGRLAAKSDFADIAAASVAIRCSELKTFFFLFPLTQHSLFSSFSSLK